MTVPVLRRGPRRLRTLASYILAKAVMNRACKALDGLTDKTVRSHVDLLEPVTGLIGNIPLRDLTAHDVRGSSQFSADPFAMTKPLLGRAFHDLVDIR